MNTLLALRIFGPCTIEHLAGLLGQEESSVATLVGAYADRGMAKEADPYTWEVTAKGQRVTDQHEELAVAIQRDEPACIGVRA